MRRLQSLLMVGVCSAFLVSDCFGQFEPLAARAQEGTNVIVAIDAEAAKKSALAQKEGWSKKLDAAFVSRSMFLPPDARQVLITGRVMPERRFERVSEVVQMSLSAAPSLPGVARANGGQLDELRGEPCVALPGDAFLFAFEKNQIGMYSPATRQAASEWISRASASKQNALSQYLTTSLSRVTSRSPIVLAIDLRDVASPQKISERLKAAKFPAASIDSAVDQLKTLQGVTLAISIDASIHSQVTVDFESPISIPASAAKTLVISALEESEMALEDLSSHEFKVSGKSITIEGALSNSSLRRIMSLLQVPVAQLQEAESPPSSTTSEDKTATASLAYFRSVVSMLDDLRGDRAKQDPRGSMDAVWMDKYAQKIDRLPVLDVDEELLDWGAKTAQTLRVMAGSRRGHSLAAGSQKSGLRTGGYGGYSDSYYSVGVSTATNTANDSNQIAVQQGNQATGTRVEGWRLIDNATADIRKKETQRYRVEF